jgi:hypothetical protein
MRSRLFVACAVVPLILTAQPAPREVRQLVTFRFAPGRAADALAIYERELVTIYRGLPAMQRFRVYRESESPVPLDAIAMTSFAGMSGMDSVNAQLSRARTSAGRPAVTLYGEISALTDAHHDEFVAMASDQRRGTVTDSVRYVAFEYRKLAPSPIAGRAGRPRFVGCGAETGTTPFRWCEIGAFLMSDGWDELAIYGLESLDAWQRVHAAIDVSLRAPGARSVTSRRVIIMRTDHRLSVR